MSHIWQPGPTQNKLNKKQVSFTCGNLFVTKGMAEGNQDITGSAVQLHHMAGYQVCPVAGVSRPGILLWCGGHKWAGEDLNILLWFHQNG